MTTTYIEIKHRRTIIADSRGLISLLIDTNSNHQQAARIASELLEEEASLLIPSEVLCETINILGKKFGREKATDVVEDLFESFAPASVSYTDCLVMTISDHYDVADIFGFDDIFTEEGYTLPVAPKTAKAAA